MTAYEPTLRGDAGLSLERPQRLSNEGRRLLLSGGLLTGDLICLVLGATIAASLTDNIHNPAHGLYPSLAFVALYLFAAINNGSYARPALTRAIDCLRPSLSALVPATLLVMVLAFLLKSSENISRLHFALSLAFGVALLATFRTLFPRYARRVTQGLLVNRLMIVDDRPLADWHRGDTVIDAGLAGIRPDLNDPAVLNRFGHLAADYDHVVIDAVPERHRDWALMLKGAHIDGEILMDRSDQLGVVGMGKYLDKSTMVVSRRPLSVRDRVRKRLLDLAITLPLIILLLPLLIFTAIAIKLDSPGPVLFRQDRFGRGNRLFRMLKFRSMYVEGCDALGNRSASRNDDRVTRVGRFIRATSIDELPQLFNVLKGDMSLVGPRPHTIGSLAAGRLFWHVDITYWHRHQLKPGITGLAQIRGYRGATEEVSDLTNRLQADMEYIQDWDIWRDIAILANTFRVVVHRNAF